MKWLMIDHYVNTGNLPREKAIQFTQQYKLSLDLKSKYEHLEEFFDQVIVTVIPADKSEIKYTTLDRYED